MRPWWILEAESFVYSGLFPEGRRDRFEKAASDEMEFHFYKYDYPTCQRMVMDRLVPAPPVQPEGPPPWQGEG